MSNKSRQVADKFKRKLLKFLLYNQESTFSVNFILRHSKNQHIFISLKYDIPLS